MLQRYSIGHPNYEIHDPVALFDELHLSHNHPWWPLLEGFLDKHWFKRLWVIQEYALAVKVSFLIGHKHVQPEVVVNGVGRARVYFMYLLTREGTLNDNRLLKGVASMGMKAFFPRASTVAKINMPHHTKGDLTRQPAALEHSYRFFDAIIDVRQSFQQFEWDNTTSSEIDFSYHFFRTGSFLDSDRRDQVYGLRGLVSKAGQDDDRLHVDYSEHEGRLSERVARYLIDQGFGVAVLCKYSLSRDPEFHGWRVKLDNRVGIKAISETLEFVQLVRNDGRCQSDMYKACGNTNLTLIHLPNSDNVACIKVHGEVIGRIEAVCPARFPSIQEDERKTGLNFTSGFHGESTELVEWIKEVSEWIISQFRSVQENVAFENNCWRTLLLDLHLNRGVARVHLRMAKSDEDNKTFNLIRDATKRAREIETVIPTTKGIDTAVKDLRVGVGMQLALSNNNRPCLVPGNCETGDITCIFHGCPSPFVVRHVSDQTYLLIGACYVHDMMDGQASKLPNRQHTDFVLLSGPPISD